MLPVGAQSIGLASLRPAQKRISDSKRSAYAAERSGGNALFPTEETNGEAGTHNRNAKHHADWEQKISKTGS